MERSSILRRRAFCGICNIKENSDDIQHDKHSPEWGGGASGWTNIRSTLLPYFQDAIDLGNISDMTAYTNGNFVALYIKDFDLPSEVGSVATLPQEYAALAEEEEVGAAGFFTGFQMDDDFMPFGIIVNDSNVSVFGSTSAVPGGTATIVYPIA